MITKDTGIIEAVQNHPEILQVFAEYGLGCVGCMAARFETLEQGAAAHGIPTIGVSWGYGKVEAMEKAGAIAIAHTMDELFAYISK